MREAENLTTDQLAQILWDYQNIQDKLEKADLIFVPCSSDVRVAEYAAEVFKKGYAPYILFTGNEGRMTKELFDKPEAEVFADIAIKAGVPKNLILLETEATNTGENIAFGRRILDEYELVVNKMIIVQKPYVLRRIYATFKKQWPEVDFMLTGPQIPYEQYPTDQLPKRALIESMVKNNQRMLDYPAKGFQIPQEMPKEVRDALDELLSRGFDNRL